MMEKRTLTERAEVRSADGSRMLVGYAAVFNSEAVIAGAFREKIMPGAFSKAIKSGDIRALFNHDSSQVLGRTKSGTLRLSEDDHGLRYEVDLPETQAGRDLTVSMDRGDIDGSSFGFSVPRGGDDWDYEAELPLRTVREVELYEVSPVTFPAYDDTSIALRSLDAAKEDASRRKTNAEQAEARIAARKARMEQQFRGINAA
jgi:HK97 family phage prohead protease